MLVLLFVVCSDMSGKRKRVGLDLHPFSVIEVRFKEICFKYTTFGGKCKCFQDENVA